MELSGQRDNSTRRQDRRQTAAAAAPLADIAGRKAPRDTDLEQAVLGALMLERDAYTQVCDILKPESFYEPVHQKIYEAIQTLGA